MKLILFELKKIIRTRIYLVFLLLTILFISGVFIRNVINQDVITVKKLEQYSKLREEVLSQILLDRKALEKGSNPKIESRQKVGDPLYDQLTQLIQEVENKKWKKELKSENNVYKLAREYKELEGTFSISDKDMKRITRLNHELLKQGLPKEDLDLSVQPSIFTKKIISWIFNAPGYIILLLILGIMITREFEEHNMRLVYALPIAKSKYIVSKFISLFFAGFIWLAVVFFMSYAISLIFGKPVGDMFNYPLFTQKGSFLNTGDYIEAAVIYSLCYTAFSTAFVVFMGFFVRNTVVTYLVVFFLFIGGWFVSDNGGNLFGNPFTYQNIDRAILDLPHVYPLGNIVLIVAMMLLLLLTIVTNRRRGI